MPTARSLRDRPPPADRALPVGCALGGLFLSGAAGLIDEICRGPAVLPGRGWRAGAPIDRARFTGRLLSALELRYEQWCHEGFAPIAAAWRALAPCLGQSIRLLEPGDSVVEGIVVDIDGDGALRIRVADGHEHRVVSGDVTVIDAYPHRPA